MLATHKSLSLADARTRLSQGLCEAAWTEHSGCMDWASLRARKNCLAFVECVVDSQLVAIPSSDLQSIMQVRRSGPKSSMKISFSIVRLCEGRYFPICGRVVVVLYNLQHTSLTPRTYPYLRTFPQRSFTALHQTKHGRVHLKTCQFQVHSCVLVLLPFCQEWADPTWNHICAISVYYKYFTENEA